MRKHISIKNLKPELIQGKRFYFVKDNYLITVYDERGNQYKQSLISKKEIIEEITEEMKKNDMYRNLNVPKSVIKEMEDIRDQNLDEEGEPQCSSDWKEAHRNATFYYKMLKKYPQLHLAGFNEDDIQYDE